MIGGVFMFPRQLLVVDGGKEQIVSHTQNFDYQHKVWSTSQFILT